MTKKTATAMNNDLRTKMFSDLMEALKKAGYELIQTDSTSVDFYVTREDDTELAVTLKATLHKEDYDMDEKVEEFQMKLDEQKKKQEEKERKAAENAKKKAEREAKKTSKVKEKEE